LGKVDVQKTETGVLNAKYLEGKRISTENIYGLSENKAHGDMEYILV
jgi:hypothetical protein